MRIGVFDSGIGGEAVALRLQKSFPDAEITTVNDRKHVPYGDRTDTEIITLTHNALQPLLHGTYNCIVIACNTATTVAIEWLRTTYPEQLFIGLEPMIKPAVAMTETGIIAVCATPSTLRSSRYQALKQHYLGNTICLEPNSRQWAHMIEHSHLDTAAIRLEIEDVISQGADVIVLACTHYHWIRELIETAADGRALVIDPSEAIARRIRMLLDDQLRQ